MKILACIDGSSYSESVTANAAWVSGRLGAAAVELLHILPNNPAGEAPADLSGAIGVDASSGLLDTLSGQDEARGQAELKKGREVLNEAEARLKEAGVADVTLLKRRGELVETICEFETGKEVIIIGKRGTLADEHAEHISPNLERIARALEQPLLVVPNQFRVPERFLIAFDGGPTSTKALEYIIRNPLLKGIECHVMAVGRESSSISLALDSAVAELESAGFTVRSSIENGTPDAAIGAYVEANGIDLLVIGAYGHSRIRSLIIGSTTTSVLMSCRIPLLLCR
jgi:nucleotide-binding universal stress UspA family protein